jgi:hypothetical protein
LTLKNSFRSINFTPDNQPNLKPFSFKHFWFFYQIFLTIWVTVQNCKVSRRLNNISLFYAWCFLDLKNDLTTKNKKVCGVIVTSSKEWRKWSKWLKRARVRCSLFSPKKIRERIISLLLLILSRFNLNTDRS